MGRRSAGRERLTGGQKVPGPPRVTGATETRWWLDRSRGLSLRNTSDTPAPTRVLRLVLLFFSTTCNVISI